MQTPAKFDYTRVKSVDEAVATLSRLGMNARPVAGGQSLLPMMKLRFASPEHLVDLNDITDLEYIKIEDDEIRIGAMTRHYQMLNSPILREHYPIFHDAEMVIAGPTVRNRGTMGGSLCQADPAEDLSAVCEATKGTVIVATSSGERTIEINDFHLGPYWTAVNPGEIVTEFRMKLHSNAGSAHFKVERRAGDWAIVATAACVWLDDNGAIADAGIALSACGLTTIHAKEAEAYLRGKTPSETVFAEAGRIASSETSPANDGRGTIQYKKHLADVLTQRSLSLACQRALSPGVWIDHPGHHAPKPFSQFVPPAPSGGDGTGDAPISWPQ